MLDGFPRTIAQAEALLDGSGEKGRQMDYAIDIEEWKMGIIRRNSGKKSLLKLRGHLSCGDNPPKRASVMSAAASWY